MNIRTVLKYHKLRLQVAGSIGCPKCMSTLCVCVCVCFFSLLRGILLALFIILSGVTYVTAAWRVLGL
jgi:hypothetical protein